MFFSGTGSEKKSMPTPAYKTTLEKMIESAHVPAVSYACVLPNEDKTAFTPISITVGKKDASETAAVDKDTRFPASSLSKIVFTYLILQLVEKDIIELDTPLYDILGKDKKFEYERLKENGKYPERAKRVTARHVLSHTTGLPNTEPNSSATPTFVSGLKLGEDYLYSGEAFLFLQEAIEAKTGKDLETLAHEYVFGPSALGMTRSTFLPQPDDDTNIVKVHSEQGQPTSINAGSSELNVANAAGSLLTTADDFSKFMAAWLKNMDNPTFQQAFQPTSADDFTTRGTRTCGLGWHIYKNKDEVIAYQYGENFNTRSLMAINVNDKKGAVFFTNSINGSSIANQMFNSPALPLIGNLQDVYKDLKYSQRDEPGSQEMNEGNNAEEQGYVAKEQGNFEEAEQHFEIARRCFKKAIELSPEDKSKQNRSKWFDEVHQPTQVFTTSLKTFEGEYTNTFGDEIGIYSIDGGLIYNQFGRETKLVRVSETDFLPEKNQSFKINISGDKMSISYVHGGPDKVVSKPPSPERQLEATHAQQELSAAREINKRFRAEIPHANPSETSNRVDKDPEEVKQDDSLVPQKR